MEREEGVRYCYFEKLALELHKKKFIIFYADRN